MHSILGKKSSFSQVTCKKYVRNSCTLLSRFTPNSFLHTRQWFLFQWCHLLPENRAKQYVKYSVLKLNIFTSNAYYTLDSSLTSIHFMRLHYPIKIQIQHFQFEKTHPKASVNTELPCSNWLNSSSSKTVILHCDAIKLLSAK